MRAQHPQVGVVFLGRKFGTDREHQDWLMWCGSPVLFTDESRFRLSTCASLETPWRECPAASSSKDCCCVSNSGGWHFSGMGVAQPSICSSEVA